MKSKIMKSQLYKSLNNSSDYNKLTFHMCYSSDTYLYSAILPFIQTQCLKNRWYILTYSTY